MSGTNLSSLEGRAPADPPRLNGEKKSHVWRWILLLRAYRGRDHRVPAASRSQAASKDSTAVQPVSVGVATVEKKDMPYYLSGLGS